MGATWTQDDIATLQDLEAQADARAKRHLFIDPEQPVTETEAAALLGLSGGECVSVAIECRIPLKINKREVSVTVQSSDLVEAGEVYFLEACFTKSELLAVLAAIRAFPERRVEEEE